MQVVSGIEEVGFGTVRLLPNNARRHPAHNLELIKQSLSMFGQVEPLVVREGSREILGGNGRHMAMALLGWTRCKIIRVECTDQEAAALALALNRTPETSYWDFPVLNSTLAELQDAGVNLSQLGWSDEEIATLAKSNNTVPADLGFSEPSADAGFSGDTSDGFGKPIKATAEQRRVFDRAARAMRLAEGAPEMSDGRIVELLAADYLAGAQHEEDEAQ